MIIVGELYLDNGPDRYIWAEDGAILVSGPEGTWRAEGVTVLGPSQYLTLKNHPVCRTSSFLALANAIQVHPP